MTYPKELTSTYDIYEQIGAGGGGIVYRAMHKRLQKEVVLKKIKGTASIQDFRTEVDILKNLRHSYLPQVLDFIESSEGIFTVMDFIPGKSLQQMLDAGHKFTEKETLKYAKQLCEALSYLHAQNPPIVHGDIKPDNVMITPEGNVCLIDFNISGILEGQGTQTFGYTPGFSSPEQIRAFEEAKKKLLMGYGKKGASFSAADSEKTVLLSGQDSEKTVLLSEVDDEKTILLSEQDDEKTVLLAQEESEVTVLLTKEQEAYTKEAAVAKARDGKAMADSLKAPVSIDRRSDIYSLGATLYALLMGAAPDISSRKTELPAVSTGFQLILKKALEQKPERRYADAEAMLRAILQVHKKDKKYRRLLLRQELTAIFFLLLLAVSVFSVVEGVRFLGQEKEQRYERLVEQLENGVEAALLPEQFDALYEEAVSLHPENVAAYYAKAYYLFWMSGTEAAESYMKQVFDLPLTGSDHIFCNLYYLFAECKFRNEEYEQAQWYYKRAMDYGGENPLLYRDYAISLIYLKHIEEAEKLLQEAVKQGMTQCDILMVQGELERALGNYDEAVECFSGVLGETDDEYMRQRAYIMASKAFAAVGTETALLQDIDWLTKAAKELSMSNRLLIYERLTEEYITLGELTKQSVYYEQAIEALQTIVEMRWDTYLTYSNIVVLYQRTSNIEAAREWAEKMCERYPEQYTSYMRLAFTEIERQNAKPENERDYTEFSKYYKEALERYREQISGNVTNAEMQLLENAYRQLIDGNWLKE